MFLPASDNLAPLDDSSPAPSRRVAQARDQTRFPHDESACNPHAMAVYAIR